MTPSGRPHAKRTPAGPRPSPGRSTDVALDALGNPMRREIVTILREGPRSVGEIAARLPVSRPGVSKHLRVLERAELVTCEREGTRSVFRLDPTGFDRARVWLSAFWDDALARFALVAENTRGAGE
jgi:DNA-binding transcriptional ArsR family regulator